MTNYRKGINCIYFNEKTFRCNKIKGSEGPICILAERAAISVCHLQEKTKK